MLTKVSQQKKRSLKKYVEVNDENHNGKWSTKISKNINKTNSSVFS